MSCPACQANTFAPHAPDCTAVYQQPADPRLTEALRAYDAEVIGRRDEVTRLLGELGELRARLVVTARERDEARESVESLADGLFTCDQLLQAEKAQLVRVKHSRKRLQARFDRARPVLKAGERFVQCWEDADAVPHPVEMPAEAELFKAVMAYVGHDIDAEIDRRMTCRRCTECEGQEHHWLTSMPECPEGGEPFISCKHCDERAALCEECGEAPVWPIVSNQPLCADCRLGEDVP